MTSSETQESEPRTFDVDFYKSLFVNREDVFAVQQPKGMYFPERRPLTNDDIIRHIHGEWSIGTYVINPATQAVSSIVFDLDILDETAADTLCALVEDTLVKPLGINEGSPLLREFSGNKGTHVWLFLSEPVLAEKVRRWVAADFMPKWTEVATENGWPTALEVFPKQDKVDVDGYGNLVKLPFGKHAVSGAFSELVAYKDWPTSLDDIWPLEADLVPDRESTVPVRISRTTVHKRGDHDATTPFACVNEIMWNGVGKGMRDNAMFHLALYCQGHGFTESQTFETCLDANEHFDPPMLESEIERKVGQAFSGRYVSAKCGADWLANICPGPCTQGWHASGKTAKAGAFTGLKAGDAIEVEIAAVNIKDGRKRFVLRHPDAMNMPTLVAGTT